MHESSDEFEFRPARNKSDMANYKSVPSVFVRHHEDLPSDAKQMLQGQICLSVCLSVPHTHDRFFFLHTSGWRLLD